MNSLLLKDILSLRGYLKTLVIIIGFFTIMSFSYEDPSFLSGMIILLMSMLPVTTFSYDQLAKWDVFSQTLPVSRKQVVMSKYMLGIIAIFTGLVLSILLNVFVTQAKSLELDILYLFQANLMIALVALLFLSILIPLIYNFGVEKSRMLIILVLAIPSLIVIGLSKVGVALPDIDKITPAMLLGVGFLCVIIAMLISYFISVRIYTKKEF